MDTGRCWWYEYKEIQENKEKIIKLMNQDGAVKQLREKFGFDNEYLNWLIENFYYGND